MAVLFGKRRLMKIFKNFLVYKFEFEKLDLIDKKEYCYSYEKYRDVEFLKIEICGILYNFHCFGSAHKVVTLEISRFDDTLGKFVRDEKTLYIAYYNLDFSVKGNCQNLALVCYDLKRR